MIFPLVYIHAKQTPGTDATRLAISCSCPLSRLFHFTKVAVSCHTMNSVAGITHFPQLLLLLLVSVVSSQSYPRFEFKGDILKNNSVVFHGSIGEGQGTSLHCVTYNSECCSNGQGNWYDERGDEVYQESDGDSDPYVTRGQGVVYLNRRGGSVGLWRCDIPDSKSIYIYLGTLFAGIRYTHILPLLYLKTVNRHTENSSHLMLYVHM